jgi:aerobic-type carbon monoxide dehydrogenase small subunit (CoxS/CutS family)
MRDQRSIEVTVNGERLEVRVSGAETLLDLLRWNLNLTGTKECCAEGECGACTVLVDGKAVNSCLVLAAEADAMNITTVEGLASSGGLSTLQDMYLEVGAVQCGFCIPGMLMASTSLLNSTPDPTTAEVREALAGNLCRCGGYTRIVEAVLRAARE